MSTPSLSVFFLLLALLSRGGGGEELDEDENEEEEARRRSRACLWTTLATSRPSMAPISSGTLTDHGFDCTAAGRRSSAHTAAAAQTASAAKDATPRNPGGPAFAVVASVPPSAVVIVPRM